MAEQIEQVERSVTPTNGSVPAPPSSQDSTPGRVRVRPGLTSVIVPCFNQRGFTQICLKSLLRHTRTPWELIVIDNGSIDDTAAYLAGVQDAAPAPVTVIRNSGNLGFPAAINQGLQIARGEYLVLLNNDAVVTDGWLDQLIALSQVQPESPEQGHEGTGESGETSGRLVGGDPSGGRRPAPSVIGLVGPMSNDATPPQWVERVPYRDLGEMHSFARRWRDEHRGQWFTGAKLSGFCVLMKRAVYDTIGGLDTRFGVGFFDDDDLGVRARRAGFELAVAHDLFVHHFGSRTFAGRASTPRACWSRTRGGSPPSGDPMGLRADAWPCDPGWDRLMPS